MSNQNKTIKEMFKHWFEHFDLPYYNNCNNSDDNKENIIVNIEEYNALQREIDALEARGKFKVIQGGKYGKR